jgi:4-hydroxybenzoyl-CoA reductase subunit gamma
MTTQSRILQLKVNGQPREILARDSDTLLDVLREQIGLTGTKRGCDLGTCGCCTVQVGGEPLLACLTLAAEVEGKAITTVEGLRDGDRFAPLQEAWAEAGASQCGFCSPGFLMAADALLREEKTPDRQRIREALAGNLCRCTGYVKIIDAVERCVGSHE